MNRFVTILKTRWRQECYRPTWLSIFINQYFLIRQDLWRHIRTAAPKLNGKMLDFGCGTKPYQSLFDVGEYVGMEYDDPSLPDESRARVDAFYNGCHIPYSNGYFDSILATEVFEHLPNVEEIVTEFYRVLKTGGYILITTPLLYGEHMMPYDFGRLTSIQLRTVLERNGFQVVELKKSTTGARALIQLCNLYLYEDIFPRNLWIKRALTVVFISWFNLLGIIATCITPRSTHLYISNIVLACKR